jgi:uncharacterized protein
VTDQATSDDAYVLPERFTPGPDATGLDGTYWESARQSQLMVQRCRSCHSWQWGPEWMCYACGSFDVGWEEVPRQNDRYQGVIYSWERVWHPTDPRLSTAIPYVILMVTLPTAGDIRMVGNLAGDPTQPVAIGAKVAAVFEHHPEFSLVQWELTGS